MTDLKFVQLPGTDVWVAVERIERWTAHATSPNDLTCVYLNDRDVYLPAWCTPQEFADLIALGLDGPPPDVPGVWRKVPEPRDCPGDRTHQHWERWFQDGSLQREVTIDGRPPSDPGRCGAWDNCVLPAGHNRGQADVPENHQPDRR